MSKASELIRLRKNGIDIPDFIIVNEKYDVSYVKDFLEKFDSNQYFAIRSSANVEDGKVNSYAGLFDTFLNVSKKEVLYKIDCCINSKKNENLLKYHN